MKTAKRRNFTLIEVMAVMMILVSLAAVATVVVSNIMDNSKISTAKTQIGELNSAVEVYRMGVGDYPEQLEDLIENPGSDNWKGPYLNKSAIPADPWQQPYIYICPGERFAFDIISYGSDKSEGGEGSAADLSNH